MNIEDTESLALELQGETIIKYLNEKITDLDKERKERLEKILLSANPPTDELVALKVVAGVGDRVKKILDEIIAYKNYKKAEMGETDEGFGL